jgi:hypothetical protein
VRRRTFLSLPLSLAASPLSFAAPPAKARKKKPAPTAAPAAAPTVETHSEKLNDILLEDLSWRAFRYFLDYSDPHTGLVKDRAHNYAPESGPPNRWAASIAATGFGLTAFCIGAERKWIGREEAARRVNIALQFFAEHAPQQNGFFYHFMDSKTGQPSYNAEASSIDTALLLAGILTACQYFDDDLEIVRRSKYIYDRVNFQWMLNGDPLLLSHGWRPDQGFIPYRWNTYSELMILYLLAIGSRTHPIPPDSWYAWKRPELVYGSYKYVSSNGPLFVHQYSHAWVDFRQRHELRAPFTDWFVNSIAATRAHRDYCISLSPKYPCYSAEIWGITASDSAKGYRAWGNWGVVADLFQIDGTIVPCAPGGSLMFTPDICVPALHNIKSKYGEQTYLHYGFSDAFNPLTKWIDNNVLGIDLGITLLSAENLRTGNVWRWFMTNPEIPRAMNLALLQSFRNV